MVQGYEMITGTHESLVGAGNRIAAIEHSSGLMAACSGQISHRHHPGDFLLRTCLLRMPMLR